MQTFVSSFVNVLGICISPLHKRSSSGHRDVVERSKVCAKIRDSVGHSRVYAVCDTEGWLVGPDIKLSIS